jgi:SAM-dependent methyltransferase
MDFSFLDFEADFSSPAAVAAYDELPLWSAMFGALLLSEVPLANVTTALDLGCGTGFPLIELAERLGARSHVHGVDPWSAALARAAAKIAVRSTPNVTLHEGSAIALPFADATFDLIVSNLGLNNFDDREAAIAEARRVARKGAVLALTTNLQGHMVELYDVLAALLRERGDNASLARLAAHVAHRATVAGVRTLLEDGGFTVRRVVERAADMRFASGDALLRHHFIKLGFLGGWKEIVAGDREIFPELIARLNAIAERNGELRLTIPMAYVEAVAGCCLRPLRGRWI